MNDEQFAFWLDIRVAALKREIRREVEQHERDMRDFIRFQNRSAGQIRRFQIATLRGEK